MSYPKERKLEWFNGNQDALNVYYTFIHLGHIWDDLIDKDVELTEKKINDAFLYALVALPSNPFYQLIQKDIIPMWITVVSAYESANKYEKEKDSHGLEIAHTLRYSIGNIVAYMIHACCGREKAAEFIAEMWKDIVFERFEEYRLEHLNAKQPV